MAMRIVWRTDGVPTSGWPDETTTGTSGALTAVPGSATSGTGWSYSSGTVTISGNGVTVSDLDITGDVVFTGTGSTLSNCKVTPASTAGWGIYTEEPGTIIEDCEIVCDQGADGGGLNDIWLETGADGSEVRRCDISGGENGLMMSALNLVIEDNYIHDLVPENVGGGDPHTDGIQLFGGNACDGSTISGNNVIAPTTWATSAMIMGDNINVTMNNNRWRGGYGVFRPWMDDTNVYTNNRIGDLSPEEGSVLVTANGGTGTPTWTGNVNDDTEASISAP
jgi:hypothetical protein